MNFEWFCPLADIDNSSFFSTNDHFHWIGNECFHHGIFQMVPAIFLFAFSPIVFHQLHKNAKEGVAPLLPKWHTIGKIFINAFLVIIFIALQTFNFFLNSKNPTILQIISTFLLFISLLLANFLLFAAKHGGIVSSGVLFNFWFLLLLFGAPEFFHKFYNSNSNQNIFHPNVFLFLLFYFGTISIFILSFIADIPSNKRKFNEKACPEQFASFPSQITYWWFNGMAALGNQRPLEMDDLWQLMDKDRCEHLVPKFEKAIKQGIAENKEHKLESEKNLAEAEIVELLQLTPKTQPKQQSSAQILSISLIRPIFVAFKWTIIEATAYKFIADLLQFVPPYLMKLLIEYYEGDHKPILEGVILILTMFIAALVQSLFNRQHEHLIFRLGMNMRSVLTCALYKKAISISSSARQRHPGGEIVNLVSNDVQQLQDMTQFIMFFWSSPLQICLALLFLCQMLGFFPVLAGFICLLASIFLNGKILTHLGNCQEKQMELKDERLNLVREMLNGIKTIKLNAWEDGFEKKVSKIREKELHLLKLVALLTTATCLCWSAAPFLVALSTFGTYTFILGQTLTPEIAFVALSLLNIIRMPVAGFATVSAQATQTAISMKRLKEFLAEEEVENERRECGKGDDENNGENGNEIAVQINVGNFGWDKTAADGPFLKNINLAIPKGSFVIIFGPIGCGKSSILSAILNEMHRFSGDIEVEGSIALVPQQAWILKMSLRDNILFGKQFDAERYEQVIGACSMKVDLENFAAGDQTILGEKGANLSGGQKQRISLARAAYSGHDIILLDDPLSGVDAHVSKEIFEHLFDSKTGFLKGKTRIMVTHGFSQLKYVDQILVIEDGSISESGTFDELLKRKMSGKFAKMYKNEKMEQINEEDEMERDENAIIGLMHSKSDLEMMKTSILSVSSAESFWENSKEPKEKLEENLQKEKEATELTNDDRTTNEAMPIKKEDENKNEEVKKVEENTKNEKEDDEEENEIVQIQIQTGRVKFPVYMTYFRAIGLSICAFCVIFLIFDCSFGVAANMWLAHWTDQAANLNATTSSTFLGIYIGLGVAQAFALTIGTVIIAIGMVNAGRIIQSKLLKNVLQSKMSFFDVTPMGRTMNRFGKDIDVVDSDLPMALLNFIGSILEGAAFLCVPIIVTPWVAPFFAIVLLIYAYSARYYIRTSRQLKRLDLSTRAPIFSYFEESVNGAISIRAYNCADRFMDRLFKLVDHNLTTYYPYTIAMRWLDFRLDFVGNLVVLASAIVPMLILYAGYDGITAGMVGLSLSYALQVTDSLNYAVGTTNELENSIISVERIDQFNEQTDKEFPLDTPIWIRLGKEWPGRGEIQIDHLATRYRPKLDLVLSGINARIGPGERIGIVGRTGAGKTTLAMAIFRLVEPCDGRIQIDGIDLARLGLCDIRSRISIVPQDPFLFTGTLQNNLDPMEKYSKEELMGLSFGLADFISTFPEKLEQKITDGGENLSGGQRQLICFGRALIRQSKLLILDEINSAMDSETDKLVQEIIGRQHKITCLKISHNIRSVLDSDRIMLIDEGKLVEFDTPQKLMDNPNSHFHSLAKAAGIEKL